MGLRWVLAVALAIALITGWAAPATAAQPGATGETEAAGGFLEERCCFSATLLHDGRVLVVGGARSDGFSFERLASAEIWDPGSLDFAPAGEMAEPRLGHSAVLQPDGRVLVIGGTSPWGRTEDAELWDPATQSFEPAPSMRHPRGHGAKVAAFPDGRALIIGGDRLSRDDSESLDETGEWDPRLNRENPGLVHKAELWDPGTGAFERAGKLPWLSRWPQVHTLDNDDVLVVAHPRSDWLRWDPDRRSFEAVGRPSVPRDWVIPLAGGRVLTTGAQRDRALDDAEVWLPRRGEFRSGGSFIRPRNTESVTPLPDGGALVYGGYDALRMDATLFRTAEYWDPQSRSFRAAGSTAFGREWHTSTVLPDGRVAFVGGVIQRTPDLDNEVTNLVELWDPESRSFSRAGRLLTPRALHTTVPLADGSLLVLGGGDQQDNHVATAELWRPPPVTD